MNVATYSAFKDELEKIAWHSGAEIAGLGILAAPTIQKMRGKPMSENATHAAEIGGLGTLAVPAAHSIYKAVKKGGLAAIKHASATKEASDLWNPSTGHVIGEGGTKAFNRGVSTAGSAAVKKPAFTLAHLQGAYQKAGIKPGLGSAVRSVASHVR